MIKVNLVPSDLLAKAAQKQQNAQVALGAVAVVILVAMISVVHLRTAQKVEKELAEKEARLKVLQKDVELVENLEKQAAELRNRLAVVNDLLKGRPLYPFFMSDLIETVPAGVQIKNMNTQSTPVSVSMNLSGEANTTEDIKEWIARLDKTGKFTNVEMGPVTGLDVEPKVFQFTLKGMYNAKL